MLYIRSVIFMLLISISGFSAMGETLQSIQLKKRGLEKWLKANKAYQNQRLAAAAKHKAYRERYKKKVEKRRRQFKRKVYSVNREQLERAHLKKKVRYRKAQLKRQVRYASQQERVSKAVEDSLLPLKKKAYQLEWNDPNDSL